MHTLFDFVTHIKNIEYLASLAFIAGFLILNEVLKAKPFGTLVQAGKEDIEHIKTEGSGQLFTSVKRIIAGPFIGLAYVAILPVVFLFALASAAVNGVLDLTSLGWRPSEAYLSGKKEDKKKNEGKNEKQDAR